MSAFTQGIRPLGCRPVFSKRSCKLGARCPRTQAIRLVAFKDSDDSEVQRKIDVEQQGQAPSSSSTLKAGWPHSRPQVLAAKVESFPLQPVFSRRRELQMGRLAMLGFLGVCIGEVLTRHGGAVAQVQLSTGWDAGAVAQLFLALGAAYALLALAPGSPTWSRTNLEDVNQRQHGGIFGRVSPLQPAKFFGFSKWGFTKRNELLHGRLAMLGFAGAFMRELMTGLGPLAQVANIIGVPADDAYYAFVVKAFVVFVAFTLAMAWIVGDQGRLEKADNVY